MFEEINEVSILEISLVVETMWDCERERNNFNRRINFFLVSIVWLNA